MRRVALAALLSSGCICGALDDAYARLADSGTDAGGRADAGLPDAGLPDAGLPDAGLPDAGLPDAGLPDAGLPDAGLPDAGPPDAGPADAGAADAGLSDGGLDGGVCRPQMSGCVDQLNACCPGSCCATNGAAYLCLPDPPTAFPGFLCAI